MALTYSGAQPQSLNISILPKYNLPFLFFFILFAVSTIFFVTNSLDLSGDSWLNKIPLHAYKPKLSLKVLVNQNPVPFDSPYGLCGKIFDFSS